MGNWVKKHRTWIVIILSLLTILFILVLVNCYDCIAVYFFSSNKSRGELLKIILSMFGGAGVIYGLWINNLRIKAQNKHNKLIEERNQDQKSYDLDKRFGDAIGYLGHENTSIVLGGIYSLNQLAKEDSRYKLIVAELFTSYLQNQSYKQYNEIDTGNSEITDNNPNIPIIIKTIVELLFNNETFKDIPLTFSHTLFKNLSISNNLNNCSFNRCDFINCYFDSNITNCTFTITRFKECRFGSVTTYMEKCMFFLTDIHDSIFIPNTLNSVVFDISLLSHVHFRVDNILDCDFLSIKSSSNVRFIKVKSFEGTLIYKDDEKFQFNNCTDTDKIIDLEIDTDA